MQLRHYGALALLAVPGVGLAQTTPPPTLPDAAALLQEGVKLHDAEKYDEAIARYERITPGDSAYASAQSELSLSLNSAKKYPESLAAAQRARALNPFEPMVYTSLASTYEALKQPAEARRTYAEGLKLFPYSEPLWVNQGIFELTEQQTAAALASLERAIELRPAKGSGHRLIGLLAARQGQVAHAMLSWATYLAIEPEGPYSHNVLVNLERLAQGAPVVEKGEEAAAVAPNEAFAELDQLLTSKVALTSAYTSKVNFKASIVKQLQLLVEKFPLEADPASDFWLRTYAPVVRVLKQGDNLTTFTYLIVASADSKDGLQWVKSNKSRVNKLVESLAVPLLALRDQQPLPGAAGRAAAWFNGITLEGLGPGERDAKGDMQPTGSWLLVGRDGSVARRGTFGATHKRTGKWSQLAPDGTLEAEQNFNATGELEGVSRYFYPNGQLRSESTYRDGKLEGDSKSYAEDGQLTELRHFKNNEFEGEALDYAASGTTTMRASMKGGKKDGVVERYFPDGTLQQRLTYVDNKVQGEMLLYYPDKTLQKKATYAQDELNGPYTTYFPNGKPQQVGQYAHDKRTGTWHTFFMNGKPDSDQPYDAAGELHGSYQDYDDQGRHLGTTEYEHGRLARLTSLDATGKVLSDTPLKKGRTAVKAYDVEGRVKRTGQVENGHLVGEWRAYYPDGTLREVNTYNDKSEEVGLNETYFNNGQLHLRRYYGPDGTPDGYFEQYYADGVLHQTGFQRKSQDEGIWKSYYATGQLSDEHEMFRDALSGPMRSYTPSGKLAGEYLYEYGKLRRITSYDSTGKVLEKTDLTPTTKEVVRHYPGSSKVMYRMGMRAYYYEGPTTWLHAGGQTESASVLHDGKRYGPYRSQFPNGQTEVEGTYLNGQRYGLVSTYYADGTLHTRGRYLAGDRVGEWTYNFPNGKPETNQTFDDNGELDGASRDYNPAGELLLERYYEHGRLVGFAGPAASGVGARQALPVAGGPVKTTFAGGKPAAEEAYAHDYPSGTFTYYYSSGQLFRKENYQKGLLSGSQVSYWPTGKPMIEESYLHGELHGRCRYYRPDGTLEREETYLAGEHAGPLVTYDAQGRKLRTEFFWNNEAYNPQ